ncbi:(2Fe-2S) ferredoxin domain-containing protein [bacterium]|nr:MAG: (2Fe-2S) ferredoxin domain-containing protein [bacterium]
MSDDFPAQSAPIRKVFICQNGDCAQREQSRALYERLLELRATHQLDDPQSPGYFRCNLSGCLDVCQGGPILVIQPDQALYHCPGELDLERIFQQHLLRGQAVPDLVARRKNA